jgi:hypothetical protein
MQKVCVWSKFWLSGGRVENISFKGREEMWCFRTDIKTPENLEGNAKCLHRRTQNACIITHVSGHWSDLFPEPVFASFYEDVM